MLAVVLYTFPGDHDRTRRNASLYLPRLLAHPKLRFYITVSAHEPLPAGFDPRVRVLRCDYPDGYEYLPDKTIRVLSQMAEDSSISHVMKVDSDVVLDPRGVQFILRHLDRFDYAGFRVITATSSSLGSDFHRGRCHDPDLNRDSSDFSWAQVSVAYLAGPCYLLSRRAIGAAKQAFDSSGISLDQLRAQRDSRGLLEDALIGWLLKQAGIAPQRVLALLPLGVGVVGKSRAVVAWLCRGGARGTILTGFIGSNRQLSPWDAWIIRTWMRLGRALGTRSGGSDAGFR